MDERFYAGIEEWTSCRNAVDTIAPLGHDGIWVQMQTVVEMNHYASRAEKVLTASERDSVIDEVAADPVKGDVIEGTGGIRKLRFARGGKGKSGGVRVVYYYYNESAPVYLFSLFGKGEKDNLSKAERNALAAVAATIKRGLKGKR